MTAHIKSIDRRHLTSVGDEGFYDKDPESEDWTRNGGEGVDTVAFTRIRTVDVMSLHLYPGGWGKDDAWSVAWLAEHLKDARKIGKPVMLGEFGWPTKADRNVVYKEWTDTWLKGGGDGALYWILSDVQDDGTLYPDYDGFTVYCPSPVCSTLSNFAAQLNRTARSFPPVADHDTAVTEFDTPASVTVTANDVAWDKARIVASSVDLDPATAGRQSSLTREQGTFVAAADGTVTFTPVAGFVGRPSITYTVQDSKRRTSNAATLTVVVKPDPGAAITIASFEGEGDAALDGWASADWEDAGTVAVTSAYATQGSQGLEVTSKGGWFGKVFASPLDLSAKSTVKFDLKTGPDAGTGSGVALKTGDTWAWCQASDWPWTAADATYTREVDLINGITCEGVDLDLTKVQAVYLYFNPGTFLVDNVRAE